MSLVLKKDYIDLFRIQPVQPNYSLKQEESILQSFSNWLIAYLEKEKITIRDTGIVLFDKRRKEPILTHVQSILYHSSFTHDNSHVLFFNTYEELENYLLVKQITFSFIIPICQNSNVVCYLLIKEKPK